MKIYFSFRCTYLFLKNKALEKQFFLNKIKLLKAIGRDNIFKFTNTRQANRNVTLIFRETTVYFAIVLFRFIVS